MPNVDPKGLFVQSGSSMLPVDVPFVKRSGVWVSPSQVYVKVAGVWTLVWEAGPTWSSVLTMRPASVTYFDSESFGMVSSRAIDGDPDTFWMSGSNSASESATAYGSIRVNIGDPVGTNRWKSIQVNCYAAYEVYMGIKKPGGSWEGAIFPSPTYSGSQGSEIQHAYSDGGDQTTANRVFSLGDRQDLANAEIQFSFTRLTVVPGYSNYRAAVKDIIVSYDTQLS